MPEHRDIRSKCPLADDCRGLLPMGHTRNSGSKHFRLGEKYQRKRPGRTAKAIDLISPAALLAHATEVIE